MRTPLIGWLVLVVIVAGCVSIPESTKRELESPLECHHVDMQMARLSSDRPTPVKRVRAVIQGVFPIAVAISLVRGVLGKPRGIYRDHWRVAFGVYNEKIDDRMHDLRDRCGG